MEVRNPWLDIAADDYVGHMASPDVGQYQVLNRLFQETLRYVRPRSVLVLGCSAGNGFEHINPAETSRVVAVDINQAYLQRLADRFPCPAFTLDLRCADLNECCIEAEAFDLVHAALVLEYVDWDRVLPRLTGSLRHHGVLSVVLQLPSPVSPAVTPTSFTALAALESVFRFVAPDRLIAGAAELGLALEWQRTEPLNHDKAFAVLGFSKSGV